MEESNKKILRTIIIAVVIGFIGFFCFGVAGAVLGYIITLLVFLIFRQVRKYD